MAESPIPAAVAPCPPRDAVDRLVQGLAARKDEWVRVGVPERISLLRYSIEGVLRLSDEWVRAACLHRDIDPRSALAGEEWVSGPMTTVRNLQLLISALEHGGQPPPPGLRAGPDGRIVATVFPRNPLDRFLFYNISAEVWIEPGCPATQGRIYREKTEGRSAPGRLALVLGAGNVSSIGPLDVAYKLFVEDQVVLLKMNPVNAYLGPVFERAFAELIERGFLGVVGGDAAAGEYLCRHQAIDTIHLTGSDRTYDAIVWGADPEDRRRRKASAQPVVTKPVTAELGCVTPILVVPGCWSSSQLEFQARHVASMVVHNASFNCNAAKVLVTARGWGLREAFLEQVRSALAAIPGRKAYYPGARERYRAFVERYPASIVLGQPTDNGVPWTVIPDVPAERGEYALAQEAFCGVLAEVTLEAADAAEFLERSVDFANDAVWGTLSCVLLVDPQTQAAQAERVEQAIARLRYGSIGVNVWTGVSFGIGVTTWGAFPGHRPERIESGVGVVHNAFLFDHPQKSVIRAPFRIRPKPVWFADHRNLRALGRQLTRFEAHHTPWSLFRVALAGLRS